MKKAWNTGRLTTAMSVASKRPVNNVKLDKGPIVVGYKVNGKHTTLALKIFVETRRCRGFYYTDDFTRKVRKDGVVAEEAVGGNKNLQPSSADDRALQETAANRRRQTTLRRATGKCFFTGFS